MTNQAKAYISKSQNEQDNYWFDRVLELHTYINLLKQTILEYRQQFVDQVELTTALEHQVNRFKEQIKILEKRVGVDDNSFIAQINKGV